MKLQLGQTKALLEGLGEIVKTPLPVKISYWLSRTIRQIQPEYQSFEEARKNLIEKYAKHDEDGNLAVIGEGPTAIVEFDDKEGFEKEFAELAETEFDVTMDALSIDTIEGIDIPIEVMLKLDPLFE